MAKTSLSRRDFLKLTGLGAVGLHPFLRGSLGGLGSAFARQSGQTLKMWWWGEQEAPGLEKYVKESVDLYQKKSGNTIEPTLQDTSVVISEFQTASAANNAPDIQYFWNGIYHM